MMRGSCIVPAILMITYENIIEWWCNISINLKAYNGWVTSWVDYRVSARGANSVWIRCRLYMVM